MTSDNGIQKKQITDNKVEYTPIKNYFQILKSSNEMMRYLTGHQLTQGEWNFTKDHINYSAQHRIDIVKNLDSESIVALTKQLRILRYGIEALESLVSKKVNQNI